jgi:hypothetical protein
MANVTKISVSLPTPLIDWLKEESTNRGIPVSQLVTEALERRTRASAFVQMIDDVFGPITDEDRQAGRALLASARTPDEILRDA